MQAPYQLGGVYVIRGAFLGSLLQGDPGPTHWGLYEGVPIFVNLQFSAKAHALGSVCSAGTTPLPKQPWDPSGVVLSGADTDGFRAKPAQNPKP